MDSTNGTELESINVTSIFKKESNKHKENSITYGNEEKEKTPIMSENK